MSSLNGRPWKRLPMISIMNPCKCESSDRTPRRSFSVDAVAAAVGGEAAAAAGGGRDVDAK